MKRNKKISTVNSIFCCLFTLVNTEIDKIPVFFILPFYLLQLKLPASGCEAYSILWFYYLLRLLTPPQAAGNAPAEFNIKSIADQEETSDSIHQKNYPLIWLLKLPHLRVESIYRKQRQTFLSISHFFFTFAFGFTNIKKFLSN